MSAESQSERVAKLTARLKAAIAGAEALEGSISYRFPDAPPIRIEWSTSDAVISNSDDAADSVVELSINTLEEMLDGKLDPARAFTQGKLRLVGELSIAMKMTGLIQNARS